MAERPPAKADPTNRRLGRTAMKRFLLIAVLLTGLALLAWTTYRGFTDVESGEHVARVSWLPESATDVSFFRSYSWTAYEFTIPEQDFLRWAADKGWDVKENKGEPRTIARYHVGLGDVP